MWEAWQKWNVESCTADFLLFPKLISVWVYLWSLGQEDPTEKEWQPTPVFSPDNPVDSGAGVLQSMSLQKSWHDLATEQQQ